MTTCLRGLFSSGQTNSVQVEPMATLLKLHHSPSNKDWQQESGLEEDLLCFNDKK